MTGTSPSPPKLAFLGLIMIGFARYGEVVEVSGFAPPKKDSSKNRIDVVIASSSSSTTTTKAFVYCLHLMLRELKDPL